MSFYCLERQVERVAIQHNLVIPFAEVEEYPVIFLRDVAQECRWEFLSLGVTTCSPLRLALTYIRRVGYSFSRAEMAR